MKILMVINPISGDEDKDHLIDLVKSKTDKEIDIFKTSGEEDCKKISQQLEQNDYERILVAGGDGTIKLVAESMDSHQIPIGIIPLGSANGLATDLNIPLEEEAYINIALGENKRTIDAININDELCLHISDLGLNAELIKEYQNGKVRGKLGYALKTIPTLFKNQGAFNFTIITDEKEIHRYGIMLAIANSRKFGTGAIVNKNGKIDDGIFELLIFKSLDVIEILKTLDEEAEISPEFLEIIPSKKVKIKTVKKIDFQIDGEYLESTNEINAEILPNRLTVFC
ncbi:diacylglycerol kinase family protein [Mesonia sp. K7]|uniref:diacylglycerol/lipid kinase family protein n=1 Tax=Mesonia sp. K7 TaxID=2218606 RepID=UPI000DA8749D|nr:diacylglycerol kinase family protein [Mesonia sp. K7]PZD77934.1 diacylglycerol kinase [Mesonia sp. K7]